MEEVELLRRKLAREKAARKEAERILEAKALELFRANSELMAIRDEQEAEIKRRIAEIKDKERLYRNLIESASDLIYTCNVYGEITYVNPMMVSRFGYSEEELIGSNFREYIPEKYRQRVQRFYEFQFKEKLQSTYTEFPVYDKEGNEIWIGQNVDLSFEKDKETTIIVLARDVSDRKKVEKSLMLSEEKYRSIIENMELGLLEVDKDGKVVKAYPKFTKLTGYTNEELVGKDAAAFFLSDEELLKMQHRNSDRLSGKSEVYEVKVTRKDGKEIWVLISGAPFYNEKGIVEGSVGIHLDITLQKELEEELRRAKQLAEDSLKSKDLFLANISHEIRTPLNAIIGISELMLESTPTREQKKYLETIMASGDNLLGLINEILDLSKIESGKLELRNEPVNLFTVIEHVYRSFSVIGGKKNLPVILNADLNPQQYHLTDPLRLKEVLFNLVGNAVKFTEEGSVTIRIQHLSESDTHDEFRFEVVDTGAGIPEEDLDDIFKMFAQATNTYVASEGGTGLGLSISKGLIENMGGKLQVSSELGKGSSFHFDIKLEKSDFFEPEKGSSSHFNGERDLNGCRILVVEDAEINRFLVNNILKKWGCTVTEVVNGREAVDILRENYFDLVLMDVRMPVMDGLKATQIIRNGLKINNLPIIALTANAIEGEVDKCKNAGMDDYLSKPYSQDELFTVITKNLSTPTFQEEKKSMVNFEGLENITQGDKAFQKRMVELFINETKSHSATLKSAINSDDKETIQKVAHTMRGAAAHICSDEVVTRLKRLEKEEMSNDQRNVLVTELLALLQTVLEELSSVFPN